MEEKVFEKKLRGCPFSRLTLLRNKENKCFGFDTLQATAESLSSTTLGPTLTDVRAVNLGRTNKWSSCVPGALARYAVHDVEVDGRFLLGHASGQEHDAGDGGRHVALQHGHGGLRNLLGGDGLGAVRAGASHGGLEEGALKVNAVLVARLVDGGEDLLLLVVGGKCFTEVIGIRRSSYVQYVGTRSGSRWQSRTRSTVNCGDRYCFQSCVKMCQKAKLEGSMRGNVVDDRL